MGIPSDQTSPRAEAEVKIALHEEEYLRLPELLVTLGFLPTASRALTDYYLSYEQSELSGWNFLRLRVLDAATFHLTRKTWVHDAQGHAIRLEEEHPIPAAEAQRLLAASPEALQLEKQRQEFAGEIARESATIVLDHLRLGGQPHYFLECEVMTDPERAQQVREMLFQWMRATLAVDATTEAVSMLELIRGYYQEKTP